MAMSSGIDVSNRIEQLRAWDVAHVWHPFTPMQVYREEQAPMIESGDGGHDGWTTVGVSTNVIDASYNALNDSITYELYRDGARAA